MEGRARALTERLVLIGLVVLACGTLVGVLLVPTVVLASDAIEFVAGDLLDVGPLPEAENPPQNSFIYAADGSELAEINFRENRIPVTLDEIPQVLIDAVIATEDAEFYEHHGINVEAILRAGLRNVRAGDIEGGGSTITQQYVKNAFLSDRATEQSLDRKIIEAVWAVELEDRLSKDEILERYLNRIYFGAGASGVAAAAERFFSVPLADLSLPQAATLAAAIRDPGGNNPIDNPEAAKARRDIVLGQMASEGFITDQQRDIARATPLEVQAGELPAPENPFWTEWVTRLLTNESVAEALGQTEALELMGETSDERIASVFQGGLRIHTTLDPEFQALADAAIVDAVTFEDETRDRIAREPLAGIVSVEPGTGAILTMALGPFEYGSCAEDDDWAGVAEDGERLCDRTKVNPIVPLGGGSGRQPGSSFKPFVIAAALEAGIPPGWTVDSDPGQVIEGCSDSYAPNNAGPGGLRDMYSGIKGSVNVFHAKLTAEVGPATVADAAGRLGLRYWRETTSNDQIGCSLGLGATEVSPLEMATAYATLANRGEYCAPYAIQRIEAPDGTMIYEHTADCEQVIDTAIVDRTVDILSGPVTPGGTAGGIQGQMGRYPTRGKTGTTDDSRDAWFVGFIHQIATASWVGYPNGERVYETVEQAAAVCPRYHDGQSGDGNPSDYADGVAKCPAVTRLMEGVTIGGDPYSRVYGGTIPAPMWAAFMTQASQRYEPEGFPGPGSVPGATVPDVMTAASLAEAAALVEAAGLNLITITEVGYQAPGTFLRQEPPPGTSAAAGNAVILYLSDGTGVQPTVPDVIGMSQAQAEQVLTAAGYEVLVFTKPTNRANQVGIVLSQTPRGGEVVVPGEGTTVVIQVGVARDDPPDEPSEEPSPTESPTPSESPTNGNGNGNGGGGNDGSEGA